MTKYKPKLIARAVLVLCILYGLVVLLEFFLICRLMAVDWDAHVEGACGDQVLSYLVHEILGFLIDLVILILPLPFIWGLKMATATKVHVTVVFSVGYCK